MQDEPTVMLGMSFFKASYDYAKATAEAFSHALWKGNGIVVGVETNGLGSDTPEMKEFVSDRKREAWAGKTVYVWDESCDKTFFPNWPKEFPKPFYQDGFSYGGAVNRLLALARIAGCQYLVRVDPGTAPPYYFREMLRYHIDVVRSNEEVDAVSGQYSDRIALRDDFVPDHKKEEYYRFVRDYTGIDPRRQLTGGAVFTIGVTAGPPPIPFPGFTPVWGSDDGLYETISESRTVVLSESRVLRTAPGAAAGHGQEYPVRVARMVVLRQLLTGSSENEADSVGCEFLELLRRDGYYTRYILAEAKALLKKRIPNIVAGSKNYDDLRRRWPEIIEKVATVVDPHCQARR